MSEIIQLSVEHLYMVMLSVFIATIIGIPIAILIYKKNFFVDSIISFVSLLQSIPSLAIFAILVPVIGIGVKLALIALVIYAILPIFINTIQGFKSINPEYYEIIDVLKISKKKAFFKVELPLALPIIISGIRLTTIYSISIATIATLVGAGGLGDLIYLGLQQQNILITIKGVIPLLIMTILVNYIFHKIEIKVLPADQKWMRKLDIR